MRKASGPRPGGAPVATTPGSGCGLCSDPPRWRERRRERAPGALAAVRPAGVGGASQRAAVAVLRRSGARGLCALLAVVLLDRMARAGRGDGGPEARGVAPC